MNGRPIAPEITTGRFQQSLTLWSQRNRRRFPWRQTADPFRLLIAEVLLQRSRSTTVAKVYDRFFARWPTPRDLAAAAEDDIVEVIRPLGLTSRASRLKVLAEDIVDRGHVPSSPQELQELPGVGRYAANATAAALGDRVPVVDGVSARVYRRYFDLPDERPPVDDEQLWSLVEEVLPRDGVASFNWAVLDLAATVCLPKRPRCDDCPLRSSCAWAQGSRSTG